MGRPKKPGERLSNGRLASPDPLVKHRLVTNTVRRTERQEAYYAAKTDLFGKAVKIIGVHDFYTFLKLPEGERQARFYAMGLAAEYDHQGTAYINADTKGDD